MKHKLKLRHRCVAVFYQQFEFNQCSQIQTETLCKANIDFKSLKKSSNINKHFDSEPVNTETMEPERGHGGKKV